MQVTQICWRSRLELRVTPVRHARSFQVMSNSHPILLEAGCMKTSPIAWRYANRFIIFGISTRIRIHFNSSVLSSIMIMVLSDDKTVLTILISSERKLWTPFLPAASGCRPTWPPVTSQKRKHNSKLQSQRPFKTTICRSIVTIKKLGEVEVFPREKIKGAVKSETRCHAAITFSGTMLPSLTISCTLKSGCSKLKGSSASFSVLADQAVTFSNWIRLVSCIVSLARSTSVSRRVIPLRLMRIL